MEKQFNKRAEVSSNGRKILMYPNTCLGAVYIKTSLGSWEEKHEPSLFI